MVAPVRQIRDQTAIKMAPFEKSDGVNDSGCLEMDGTILAERRESR